MLDIAPPRPEQPVSAPESTESPTPRPVRSLVGRLAGALPALLIWAALAGLAFWGHHVGWVIPSFSVLMGNDAGPEDDWCAAHNVPESVCVECQPALMPRATEFGWCKKHGVSECPLCHPEVAQLQTKPSVTQADRERARRALAFAERPANDKQCKKHLRRLQFASPEAVSKAGIDTKLVWEAPMVECVAANGAIAYDQTRVARLSSRLPGTVWQVDRQVGDRVQKGEVLALVEAAEVGRAKAEFLQAFSQVDLKTTVYENLQRAAGSVPARTVQEAEAAFREARIRLLGARQALINLGLPIQVEELKGLTEDQLAQRLQLLGLPETVVRTLDPRTTTANLIAVKAPLDGVVVAREVVAGEVVDTAKVLFVVADPRRLWLNLDVRLEDARHLALGQTVHFRPDGWASPGAVPVPWYRPSGDRLTWIQTSQGKITWISTAVDDRTRTVKVRAELDNPEGRLRAGTFGAGRIVLREAMTVVVPKEALEWEGCCHVVFVRDKNYLDEGAPKVFHVRKVVPGARDDRSVEIIAGVLPGEVVVTSGSGVLRSELLKNDLGDG